MATIAGTSATLEKLKEMLAKTAVRFADAEVPSLAGVKMVVNEHVKPGTLQPYDATGNPLTPWDLEDGQAVQNIGTTFLVSDEVITQSVLNWQSIQNMVAHKLDTFAHEHGLSRVPDTEITFSQRPAADENETAYLALQQMQCWQARGKYVEKKKCQQQPS